MPAEPTPLFLVYDGSALDGLLYRIVERCPPSLEDFLSYEVLGQPYNRRDYFKGVGVSMRRTQEQAISAARRYGHGRAVGPSIFAVLRGRGRELARGDTSQSGRRPSFSCKRWFNVTTMSENQYTLFHRPTGNWLDWFDTLEDAIEGRARWVDAAPEAAPELEIWDDEKGVRIEIDPETASPAPAA